YGMVAASQGLFGLGLAFALALSAMLFRDGALTIGAVFLIFRYTEMLRQPTEQIRNEIQDLQQAGASLGRIDRLLKRQSRLTDGAGNRLPSGPLAVDLEQVWFGYEPGTPVLRGIDLHLAPQRVLGILGRTGSGKTTLARLLLRLYDPSAGVVRVGGVDLRDVPLAEVRRRVGMVTQDVQLFRATVRDNLTFFDPSISDAQIVSALEALGLGEWLRALPCGLDTELGPQGAGLSAGEAQLLAFTRIVLKDPGLVILDEASSRLDPATERRIERAIDRLLGRWSGEAAGSQASEGGRTGIIIAHRLATVERTDEIAILDGGQVVERGERRALALEPTSRFHRLLQTGLAEVLA
ncbi:MAG: ABC transporter ATP-binding protein, partial [Chloroflexota bacterium]